MFGNGLIGIIILGVLGIIAIFKAVKTVQIIVIVVNKRKFKLRILTNRKNMKEVLHFFSSYGIEVGKINM